LELLSTQGSHSIFEAHTGCPSSGRTKH